MSKDQTEPVFGGTNFASSSGRDESPGQDHTQEEEVNPEKPQQPPAEFRQLKLDRIDPNLFLARTEGLWKPPGARAVFGGQVVGQSLSAASQTVQPELSLHSLHAYFVRAGQPQYPIVYDVKRVRNGQSFATRSVSAKQNGRYIFTMQASFHKPELASYDHQLKMPKVPHPHSLPTSEQRIQQMLDDPNVSDMLKAMIRPRLGHVSPIDVRTVLDATNFASVSDLDYKEQLNGMGMPSQIMWFRVRDRLSDDEHVHHAVLAYQSDAGLMGTARVGKEGFWESQPMMASLDHSMWFHLPFPNWRADEWLLYIMYSPRMTGARCLSHGHIFTQDGRCVVSCTQEGLMRLGTDRDLNAPQSPQLPSKL